MRVLILGGTTEASRLADALAGDGRHDATLSLAGVTRHPLLPAIPVRIGGFGGADRLAAWLQDHATEALVDATHPFAQAISRNAVLAAAEAGVPLLRVARPEWRPVPGDRWTVVPTMRAAAAALGPVQRRVLLTVGTREVGAFRDGPAPPLPAAQRRSAAGGTAAAGLPRARHARAVHAGGRAGPAARTGDRGDRLQELGRHRDRG